MDVKEFIKQVQPRKKRSRLLPFISQIKLLKEQSYTDLQIRDWLASNGVDVSRETVRKFIRKTFEASTTGAPPLLSSATRPKPASSDSEIQANPLSQADKMRLKLAEQKEEADSKLFKHDKTGKK